MFCLYCGTDNPSTANFCRRCGKWQRRELGTPAIKCLYCQQDNPQDASFCRNCGKLLMREVSAPPPDIALPRWPLPGPFGGAGQAPAGQLPMVEGTPQVGNVPGVQGAPSAPSSPVSGQGGLSQAGQLPPHGGASSMSPGS